MQEADQLPRPDACLAVYAPKAYKHHHIVGASLQAASITMQRRHLY